MTHEITFVMPHNERGIIDKETIDRVIEACDLFEVAIDRVNAKRAWEAVSESSACEWMFNDDLALRSIFEMVSGVVIAVETDALAEYWEAVNDSGMQG